MKRGGPVREPETKPSNASVSAFLAGVKDPLKRADCKAIAKMMREATGKRAQMWGQSIIGYDQYDYTYASGRSGSWRMSMKKCLLSLSPIPSGKCVASTAKNNAGTTL